MLQLAIGSWRATGLDELLTCCLAAKASSQNLVFSPENWPESLPSETQQPMGVGVVYFIHFRAVAEAEEEAEAQPTLAPAAVLQSQLRFDKQKRCKRQFHAKLFVAAVHVKPALSSRLMPCQLASQPTSTATNSQQHSNWCQLKAKNVRIPDTVV